MKRKRKQGEPTTSAGADAAWYALNVEECTRKLGVGPSSGLSAAEAEKRLEEYGPNELAEEKRESVVAAFLRQYRPLMQLVLVGAAAVSIIIGDYSTTGLLVCVTVFNAILGMIQESKAQRSVDALKGMLVPEAHVRRDGEVVSLPAARLVPGDILLIREGDRIPADGRLLSAATLEVEESTLTGESSPVLKSTDAIATPDVPLGDRVNMLFMNTDATRGRGEMMVTATGMSTQVGGIADSLQEAREEKTPLMKQLDQLIRIILIMAGVAFASVLVSGLIEGEEFSALFTLGVALSVGAIPDALPAVVTSILSIGTVAMARRKAIIKHLPSVETLGSTSAICSDKTGTLTMNQMTVRTLILPGARYNVTGHGYSTDGDIQRIAGQGDVDLEPVLLPMVLCSDATVHDGKCVGDPNEGALVVLAAKQGIDAEATRAHFPRLATLPFDSQYMLMATFHEMDAGAGDKVVRCFVKGAPDKLMERSSHIRMLDGKTASLDDEMAGQVSEVIEKLAGDGLRELAVASRDFDPQTFDPGGDLLQDVSDLTLLSLVGIQDPPRKEAKDSIAESKKAGIHVRMITGDHAVTAAAVARELGIEGRVITGTDFEAMSDEEVASQIDGIGVLARVAPQDKVRMVKSLQVRGDIVAMTGDGVNDAPALKTADIGVAMGLSGTDVARGASDMVLADDNFSTIVGAVEEGRIIYDNLMKFIRMQMSNLVGFILGFLAAGVLLSVSLFTPGQVIWVHFGALLFIGAALGFDTPTPGLMQRKPRPSRQPIIDLRTGIQIAFSGILMAAAALLARQWVMHTDNNAATAQTMALTVFAISHIAIALNLRYPDISVFRRESLSNLKLFLSFLWAIAGMVVITEIPLLQDAFNTTALTPRQWALCLGITLAIMLLGEAVKPLLGLIPGKKKSDIASSK
ncbi:MAG: HAD family hydrolase [Actinobacteria bacterium]|jgi:Ca2+-transporting ATPase|nr:MAG: HAD family hydrolase [Actinomycetota bacterium]